MAHVGVNRVVFMAQDALNLCETARKLVEALAPRVAAANLLAPPFVATPAVGSPIGSKTAKKK